MFRPTHTFLVKKKERYLTTYYEILNLLQKYEIIVNNSTIYQSRKPNCHIVKICYSILCFVTKQFSAKKGNCLLLCGVITTNCRANLYTRQWKTICDEVHIHNGAFHKFFPWGQKSDSNNVRKVRENVLKANFCSVIEWHFEHFTKQMTSSNAFCNFCIAKLIFYGKKTFLLDWTNV